MKGKNILKQFIKKIVKQQIDKKLKETELPILILEKVEPVQFSKKYFKNIIDGEDLVDDKRKIDPTEDRFVVCDEKDIEIKRFILLEDALQYVRSIKENVALKTYALKSGALMSERKKIKNVG